MGRALTDGVFELLDGVNFWMGGSVQNASAPDYTRGVRELRQLAGPELEIVAGAYFLYNPPYFENASAFRSIVTQSARLYDEGEIEGLLLFEGPTLTAERMPWEVWEGFNLPGLLAEEVTPFLGDAAGRVVDCHGAGVAGAVVVVRWGARQVFVTRKRTDAEGRFGFGGWVGRASCQPHTVTVTAAGHAPAHVQAQLTPAATTAVNVRLDCPDRPSGSTLRFSATVELPEDNGQA